MFVSVDINYCHNYSWLAQQLIKIGCLFITGFLIRANVHKSAIPWQCLLHLHQLTLIIMELLSALPEHERVNQLIQQYLPFTFQPYTFPLRQSGRHNA